MIYGMEYLSPGVPVNGVCTTINIFTADLRDDDLYTVTALIDPSTICHIPNACDYDMLNDSKFFVVPRSVYQ